MGYTTTRASAAVDPGITDLAQLDAEAGDMIVADGEDQYSVDPTAAYGRSLLDATDEANFKALVNLEIGTDVQAYSAVLAATTASFTTADETKLDGIEAGATGDQTGAEIKALYEAEADTNAFDDAAVSKLAGIEALADVTDATNVAAAGAVMLTGAQDVLGAKRFDAKTKFGDSDDDLTDVNPDVPGGKLVSVTSTSTAVDGTNNYLQQNYYIVNPGSNQASDTDHRTVRFEVESRGSFDIFETIGGSFYNFHRGSGSVDTAYGGTNQFFNSSTGEVTTAYGSQGAVWNNGEGLIETGYGGIFIAASYRSSAAAPAFTSSFGSLGEVSQRGTGIITDGRGVEGDVIVSAAGTITTGIGVAGRINITDASGEVTNAYGVRSFIGNSGSITNAYGVYISSLTGNAPSGDYYGLYQQDDIKNYLRGRVLVGQSAGDDTVSRVIIDQSGSTYGLTVEEDDAGAQGPTMRLRHHSASPAANDVIGTIGFHGRDSAANDEIYAQDACIIEDPTSASEDATREFYTTRAGTLASRGRFGNGLVVGVAGTQDVDLGWLSVENGVQVGDSGLRHSSTARLRLHRFTVGDDAATSYLLNTSVGGIIDLVHAATADGIRLRFDTLGTDELSQDTESEGFAAIDVTTGALTGTTGTDVHITVSIHSDHRFYIENRSGSTRTFTLMILD